MHAAEVSIPYMQTLRQLMVFYPPARFYHNDRAPQVPSNKIKDYFLTQYCQ